uniref:Uncharacterized protein n=1 Tax=Siphoviridae sp. ctJ0s2 TaxID=2827834 RepID=A0A8S5TEG9_9CAUD|nr:MAG TPA: hypothetical protein [Siphoviridae sp. ctJ0s2]
MCLGGSLPFYPTRSHTLVLPSRGGFLTGDISWRRCSISERLLLETSACWKL